MSVTTFIFEDAICGWHAAIPHITSPSPASEGELETSDSNDATRLQGDRNLLHCILWRLTDGEWKKNIHMLVI